jgi:hypothetical protein
MERLYLITIRWAGAPDQTKVEAALPGRWLRFSPTSWLLWSTALTTQEIYSAIAPKLTIHDFELILHVDEDDWYGYAEPWIWTWIKSKGATTT